MLELLLIPAAALLYAANAEKWKKPMDDRKKIQVFFEVAGIAIKREDKLQYPVFEEKKEDDRSMTYIYKLPMGMPSKIIEKVEEVVGEGLNKPVRITYNNYKLYIRVFSRSIPQKWNWSPKLVQMGKWKIPMGQSLEKLVWHDFDKIPHMTLGGLTRMGKTVFLKMLFTHLSAANPEHAHFFIIDLKEQGLEFDEYRNLKQVKDVAINPQAAYQSLKCIMELMKERGGYMKERKIKDITKSNERDRFFIIVDEAAVMAPAKGLPKKVNEMLEECQHMFSHIARVGGGLGFRLIFCTQYPTGDTLPRVVKQMADAKLGLRVTTRIASEVVIDDSGLEHLPSIKGRAIYKTDRLTELQVPYISDEKMWEVLREYEVIPNAPAPMEEARTGNEDTILH